jgi:hypothetical protein
MVAKGYSPTFFGIVGSLVYGSLVYGFLVYDRCKCISLHYPPPPFLTDDLAGCPALETPDERNNIIKLVLPYIVMCSRFAPLFFLSVCHLMSYRVPRSLHDPIALVKYYDCIIRFRTPPVTSTASVTDLQGPPSECTQSDKIRDLKSLAQRIARDRGSCDDTQISYLEYVESEAEADLTLARMIAG